MSLKKVTNQHGDFLVCKILAIPEDAKQVEVKKGFIFERGEGIHTHVLKSESGVEIFMKDEDMYLNVIKEIEINHEEHGIQTIEPGIYKKDIERQYDYETEEARRVMD